MLTSKLSSTCCCAPVCSNRCGHLFSNDEQKNVKCNKEEIKWAKQQRIDTTMHYLIFGLDHIVLSELRFVGIYKRMAFTVRITVD